VTRSAGAARAGGPDREAAGVQRPQRADARRNRDALLAAAVEAYGERGVDASLEDIARRAGVGIGTLYRHFPNRDAVTEAVYRREVENLSDSADQLLAEHDPEQALMLWMRQFAVYVGRKRGMAMALRATLGSDNELFAYTHDRITQAITKLVDAAAADGTIRGDVDPSDLLRAMSGICMAADTPGWSDRTGRLINLLIDGMRYGAPGSS